MRKSQTSVAAADTSRDPHFRSAKEMRSFDLTEPLFYISTKRIKGNSGKKKLKHKSMKHEGRIHHHVAAMGMRERPQVKQLPFRSRLYFWHSCVHCTIVKHTYLLISTIIVSTVVEL